MAITVNRAKGTVEFCQDLNLQAEWEAATSALAEAQKNPSDLMVNVELTEAAAKVRDIEQKMNDSVLVFELQASSRKVWQELEAAHPPREGVKEDEAFSLNVSTFFDAVLSQGEPHPAIVQVTEKTTGKVVGFDPATEWRALADEMTDGQYSEFAVRCLGLNRGSTKAPFSLTASRVTATSNKS